MSSDEFDDETFRERIAANPRPALIWFAGFIGLVAIEFGKFAAGILSLGSAVRFVLDGVAAIPNWIGSNVADSLGTAAGLVALAIASLALLWLVGTIVARWFLPWSPADRFQIEADEWRSETVDQAVVTALLAVVALLIVATPLGGVLESGIGWLTRQLEGIAGLPRLTSRELIPNQGYRSPGGGGWEETFLGLSPAMAWAIRVFLVYAYAFVFLAWLWKGYTVFREHYREADWTPRDDSINRFRNHYWGIFGLAVVFAFVVMAIWAPTLGPVPAEHNLFNPYGYEFQYLEDGEVQSATHGTANLASQSKGGSSTVTPLSYDDYGRWAPFGTNQDGKDLFTFLVYGARTSLVIGLTAIGLGTLIALTMSLVTAYYKGLIDVLTIITTDTIISIPGFLLVLLLSVIFQEANHPIAAVYDGGLLLALIFALIYWPGLWRSIRGPSLQVAEQEWVDAAKSYGQTPLMTMRKHMAPYIAAYIMIYASLLLGAVIIATAALSFLGLGIEAPTPEWGRMVSDGRSYVSTSAWHIATIPGVMIVFVVTGFNALGDGIRDAMDPESDVSTSDAGAAAAGGGG